MSNITLYPTDSSLIKIHKRRLNVLIGQAKAFGVLHCPAHIINEIKYISGEIRGLYSKEIGAKGRRLQLLKENQAIHGINTDPAVSIEIEDLDKLIEMLQSQFDELEKYTK